jgi:hypothetical protein
LKFADSYIGFLGSAPRSLCHLDYVPLLQVAHTETVEFLRHNPDCYHSLESTSNALLAIAEGAMPLNREEQQFGLGPMYEAETDARFAVTHLLQGAYSSAYLHTRRCLEMYLFGLFMWRELTPEETSTERRSNVKNWLASEDKTPSISRVILPGLFAQPRFANADVTLSLLDAIKAVYADLSNIVHGRGRQYGHHDITNGNVPHFLDDEFTTGITRLGRAIESIAVCLILHRPAVMLALPLNEKFGANAPFGLLEEPYVRWLKGVIRQDWMSYLVTMVSQDSSANEIREMVEERDDLSTGECESTI